MTFRFATMRYTLLVRARHGIMGLAIEAAGALGQMMRFHPHLLRHTAVRYTVLVSLVPLHFVRPDHLVEAWLPLHPVVYPINVREVVHEQGRRLVEHHPLRLRVQLV